MDWILVSDHEVHLHAFGLGCNRSTMPSKKFATPVISETVTAFAS